MITEHNINEWAERYLRNELSEGEVAAMHRALDADPELNRHWKQVIDLLRLFETKAARKEVKDLIRSVAAEHTSTANTKYEKQTTKAIPFRKYLRTTAAAAGLILCSSVLTLYVANKKNNKVGQKQYIELVRELNNIKHSQTKIIDSLNKNKEGDQAVTEEEIAYGGTGFAISNDGYLATNYHVVKDANAIYVQTRKGDMKAYIVAREPKADIAILKLEDKNYRFGKSSLPYSIAKSTSNLGQKVFTIGYPKDDVVYNEGYISCENGYDGDAHSYQLEITANPGQSGSPVLDNNGSVIALITGKQSNTTGTTYAIHSGALIELVQSLPKSAGIRMPESNRLNRLERTEQVKKLRDYVFSIKVN